MAKRVPTTSMTARDGLYFMRIPSVTSVPPRTSRVGRAVCLESGGQLGRGRRQAAS